MVKKKSGYISKRKRIQKIVYIVLTVFLSIGLLSSSVIWLGGDYLSPPPQSESAQTFSAEEIIKDMKNKVKENPNDAQALVDLARACMNASRLEEALEAYEKAIAIKPDDNNLRYEVAMIYFLSGKYDKAINNLEVEIKQNPEDKDAHYLYAYVLATGKKDYRQAIDEMEKFIKIAKTGDDVVKARQMIKEWEKHLSP